MTIDLAIRRDSPTGERDILRLNQATRATISTNSQGDERCDVQFPAPLADQFRFRDRAGLPYLVASAWGQRIFTGRVEDPTLTDQGLGLAALGGARALTDIPYTALWSTASYDGWRTAINADPGQVGSIAEERYETDTQNRIFISPEKGANYTLTDQGRMIWFMPSNGLLGALGVQFDARWNLPTNWQVNLYRYSAAGAFLGTVWTAGGTGALATQSVWATFATTDILVFAVLWNGGGTTTYAAETGAGYLEITNLRVVSATVSAVSTVTTATRTNGVGVTITVATTARMYVGQRLFLAGGGNTESLLITSITSATQFVATVANAPGGAGYPVGTGVFAHVIYANEVVAHLATTINGINSGQLSSSSALIQSPARDLIEAQWLDAAGDGVLNDLIERGDANSPPRRWRWYVDSSQRLGFADPSSISRTWYVDVTSLEALQSIESLINSAYATYEAPDGMTTRTAVSADAQSVLRFGVTRRAAVSAQATNAAQAEAKRDTAIADGKNPPGRATITFDAVYDARGASYPPWLVRGGDVFVIRNLPPAVLGGIVDRIRSFRLARTEYDVLTKVLTVEPEEPQIGLSAVLVRGRDGGVTPPANPRAGGFIRT